MRAVRLEQYGDPSGLVPADVPAPTPTAGQILIRTAAIGVGGVDAVMRRGTLVRVAPEGVVPGSEVAGVVEQVGDGVDPGWVGRRVWATPGLLGGYAEQVTAHLDDVTELPDDLSFVDAAALGSSATVAHFALEHARFAPGERVLVRGAAGSIGISAVELAARRGAAAVAVTTSSAQRGERLRALGATHVLDRSGAGDDDASYDVVVDIVGGPDQARFIDRLAPNGRLVLVGGVAGFPPDDFGAALIRSFQQSRSFATFSLNTIAVDRRNAARADLLRAAARGELTPVVHDVLPLDRAADAHRQMDDGAVLGRIVLVPEG